MKGVKCCQGESKKRQRHVDWMVSEYLLVRGFFCLGNLRVQWVEKKWDVKEEEKFVSGRERRVVAAGQSMWAQGGCLCFLTYERYGQLQNDRKSLQTKKCFKIGER